MLTSTQTIGIVGGTSPESTVHYYQYIVRRHQQEYGDHSYPRIVISSVSFQQYIDWQHAGDWDRVAAGLQTEFHAVAAAGADFGLLAANTMHKVLPQIESPIPVLSILDAVAEEARRLGMGCLGLTGTRFVMADGFYARGLEDRGIRVVLPGADQQAAIHRIIYEQLIAGLVTEASVEAFHGIGSDLADRGADAVLLACTELEMLTHGKRLPYATLDTAVVHAGAAWRRAVGLRQDGAKLMSEADTVR